ncbi:hypothetical protein [Bacillus paramycoides]|uniref:hypothetical protein n=1 Tax=Bacillus paramycoides TaxID=2026194 RepID=UPI002E20A188|nr:hypothetical protein [Bacillus paramycoides]
MNIGSSLTLVTSSEIRAIDSYLKGSETSSDQALKILKFNRFKAKEILKGSRGSHYYYASEETQEVYEYYKALYPNVFTQQRIKDYDDLLSSALVYCCEYGII